MPAPKNDPAPTSYVKIDPLRKETMRAPLIPLLLLAFPLPAISAENATPAPTPLEKKANGFPVPKLDGYEKLGTTQADLALAIDGAESRIETWQNKAGDRVMKMETNGVVWAYGFVPAGAPEKGHVLRDPTCAKKLTEKWAATTPFSAPDCAVKAKPK